MLRGDSVNDDSGFQAVLTTHRAHQFSQVAAATSLDTVSTISGKTGEANDAAYTQVSPRL